MVKPNWLLVSSKSHQIWVYSRLDSPSYPTTSTPHLSASECALSHTPKRSLHTNHIAYIYSKAIYRNHNATIYLYIKNPKPRRERTPESRTHQYMYSINITNMNICDQNPSSRPMMLGAWAVLWIAWIHKNTTHTRCCPSKSMQRRQTKSATRSLGQTRILFGLDWTRCAGHRARMNTNTAR